MSSYYRGACLRERWQRCVVHQRIKFMPSIYHYVSNKDASTARSTARAASPTFNGHQTESPPSEAGRQHPAPTVLLPLITALAKLQNDPRQLVGWELRLLPSANKADHGAMRHRGRRNGGSLATAGGMIYDGSNVDGRLGRSLGHVVEVVSSAAVVVLSAIAPGPRFAVRRGGSANAAVLATATAVATADTATPKPAARVATAESCGDGDDYNGVAERQGILLRAVRHTIVQQYNFAGSEEYVVHLDPDALQYADMTTRTLIMAPAIAAGADLLAQGRKSLLLQLLDRELRNHIQALHGTNDKLELPMATAAQSAAPPTEQQQQQQGVRYGFMPTRQQLLAAGRRDLVALIGEAGGFVEVALHLGLRCTRRPRGYWSGPDSWKRLGEELAGFVAAGWVELPHPEYPGKTYWYNQVSHRTTWRRPPPLQRLPANSPSRRRPSPSPPSSVATHGSAERRHRLEGDMEGDEDVEGCVGGGDGGVRWLVAEAAADRVMPSRSLVLQARRLDLHNAIEYHGGYLHVASRLGRRVTWAPSKHLYDSTAAIRRELNAVAKELQLPPGVLPTSRELRQAGYCTLLNAVRRHEELRNLLGIRPRPGSSRRRPRGQWDDLGALAAELTKFSAAAATSAVQSSMPAASCTQHPAVGMRQDGVGGSGGGGDVRGTDAADAMTAGDGRREEVTAAAAVASFREGEGRDGGWADTPLPDSQSDATDMYGQGGDTDPVAGDGGCSGGKTGATAEVATTAAVAAASSAYVAAATTSSRSRRGRPRKSVVAVAPAPPLSQQQQQQQQNFMAAAAGATNAPAPPTPRMPRLSQLRAAGRYDLVYALSVRHAGVSVRQQLAELTGLELPADRRGSNRNALSLEAVVEAIQDRCHTPKAIGEYLSRHRQVEVSRQHLNTYLARAVAQGKLVKLSYGKYGLGVLSVLKA